MRWPGICVAVAAAVASLVVVPVAAAQDPIADGSLAGESVSENAALGAVADPSHVGDEDLNRALGDAQLLEEWLQASTMSTEASLLSVQGGSAYTDARRALLEHLAAFSADQKIVAGRFERLQQIDVDVERLLELVLDLRRQIVTTDQPQATALYAPDIREAQLALAQIKTTARAVSFSLDPVDLAEHRLWWLRHHLGREIERIGRTTLSGSKTSDGLLARLAWFPAELASIETLVDNSIADTRSAQDEFADDLAVAVDMMPELHRLRARATTEISDLPLVTVDAYISGAAMVDGEPCAIDWSLLAGIGRIESRHGTMGGSSVQSSGRLTTPIFGPLLDGGATAREAAEAARSAEEEAELAAAEEAAIAEEEAAALRRLNPDLWGEEAAERAETAGQVDEYEGLWDPKLWGNDVPFDVERPEEEQVEDGQGEDEEEEEGSRGNGFAVIEDTDNGRMDGNSRWDRAVGPMQFIPQTWSYWATDGSGDDVADAQNLYDASASAARFLCSLSQQRGSSPYVFVLGYNASDTYVRNVMAVANRLSAIELPQVRAN